MLVNFRANISNVFRAGDVAIKQVHREDIQNRPCGDCRRKTSVSIGSRDGYLILHQEKSERNSFLSLLSSLRERTWPVPLAKPGFRPRTSFLKCLQKQACMFLFCVHPESSGCFP